GGVASATGTGDPAGTNHRRRPLHAAAHMLPGQLRQGADPDDRRRHPWSSYARGHSRLAGALSMSGEARAERQPLTYRMRPGQPPDLKAYQAEDGYAALRLALKKMAPRAVSQNVKDATLRGRGGAGSPPGRRTGSV